MVFCDAGEKPLIVLHFLHTKRVESTLCFTSSVESTHRLYKLLQLYGGTTVAEFSSNLPQQERTRILQEFKDGKIQLLICSDGMARGLDIEHVGNVISYDPPAFVKTYVHRVGRTARAGREGNSFTILSPKEVRHFKGLMLKTSKKKIERYILPRSELSPLIPRYQEALTSLKSKLHEEKSGHVLVEAAEAGMEDDHTAEMDPKTAKMFLALKRQMGHGF